MRISHFFIDRPIFAAVVSIVFVIIGGVSFSRLPVAQYPEIAPPIINVSGQYPGASADVVASTVVTPIEQQINGVENMIYMSSNSTADGRFSIAVTFDLGTNLDVAQVQVQNRVAIAQPRLPVDVRNIGVTVTKSSPDLMMVVHLYSPDKSRDSLFISNYATLAITDTLTRVDGVGSITVFGSRDYSMRVWVDPDRLQTVGLTAGDVVLALQAQNVQVAGGVLDQPPMPKQGAFQFAVRTLGRLANPEEFANIVVKESAGAVVRLKDVARIELAAQDYTSNSYLDRDPAVALAIFQRPGSNALATAKNIIATMDELATRFPAGIQRAIVYNPTEFIQESVNAVIETIGEAVILVVLVVILFLQTWRAAVIPIVAIPVSLVGTFFFMALFGFTLNNLSLFGLVLAIGIVVDDAIVVVENVERNIESGLSPRDAAYKSMDEVGGALVAIALVLCAVFVPSAFITGISGQFYRQFALTIASATIISLIVSLTLSPAMCALLLKPRPARHEEKWWERPIRGFFRGFNWGFERLGAGYHWLIARAVRYVLIMLVLYVGILAYGLNEFRKTPIGFIPQVDRGYLIVVLQLPAGSSLSRTDEIQQRVVDVCLKTPGVAHAVNIVGFNGATFTQAPNSGAVFLTLEPWDKRGRDPKESAAGITAELFKRLAGFQEALILVIQPPPVAGIGNAGGVRMMVEDRAARGSQALLEATTAMVTKASQTPGLTQVFTLFENSTPQIYLDIDRTKAQMLGINVADVFGALQVYIGSAYVNDFNLLGRTFRVTTQADAPYRRDPGDILKIRVRNSRGETVPLGSFTTVRNIAGPYRVPRYNLYPAAELDATAVVGYSQGQVIDALQKIAAETLPDGFGYEWTTLAFQQIRAGSTAVFAFALAVVFVFLVLAAQFESLTLPLAVILIVPMCLVASISGVILRGQDNNILTQVGFIVLIGLAAKNAILIVEFAKQLEDQGRDRWAAAVEAARLRLRPILMTSLAFIFGVMPLVWAIGAGAELRQTLGTAVFAGMIGVTAFGLVFTPIFYVVCRWLAEKTSRRHRVAEAPTAPAE
ncbi:MAG TPA: multidrug efflux RND transporter permease subunit [Xanthobacteraceae bacterium]|nr:multidrug efflux RND transporter permease subunit [Xanthobacteraceae bacterium]